MKLDGSVAVVIGGARGIGKAYCVSLLERGAKVLCSDVLDDVGRQTEAELQQNFGADRVVYKRCDGTSEEQITATLNFAKSHFGKLEIVINNVGIADEGHWEQMININLGTTIRVTNAAFELLGKDKGGSGGVIVHTSSNSGLVPAFYIPVYSATKAAIIAYTRAWAHEINYNAHGVRMFTLCPSTTDTPFLQQNADPTRVVKLDVLLKLFDPSDKSKVLKPEWLGEALVKGLEDDSVNGVAIQLLTREPVYHFVGQNSGVLAAASKQ